MRSKDTEKKKFASIAVFTVVMYLSLFMTFFNVISMLNQLSHKFLRLILCCTNGVCTSHQVNASAVWSVCSNSLNWQGNVAFQRYRKKNLPPLLCLLSSCICLYSWHFSMWLVCLINSVIYFWDLFCCSNGVCTLHQFNSMQYWYKMTGKQEAIKKFSTDVCSIRLCC